MSNALLLTATSFTTSFSRLAVSAFNIHPALGISAAQGQHFLALSWANVGLSFLVSLLWGLEMWLKKRESVKETMRLHQEHYERARIWGKIGAIEEGDDGPGRRCSCVDPWKVLRKPRFCGDEGMKRIMEVDVKRDGERPETADWNGEDQWRGVEEKVLIFDR
jgi:hypothetical protein